MPSTGPSGDRNSATRPTASTTNGVDGRPLTGLRYGLRFDVAVVAAFSELADQETTGIMLPYADALVSGSRLTA